MHGKAYLVTALSLAVHAFGCGAADDAGLKVDVQLDQTLRASQPIRVDVYLIADCESVVVGLEPEGVIASTFQLEDLTTGPPLSDVGPGEYGLYVIARDIDCFVVGTGCDDVAVAERDDASLSITVPEFLGAGCSDDELCVDGTGECVPLGGTGGTGGTGATGGAGGTGGDPVIDCRGEADGTACRAGRDVGECHLGECCTGCWDGSTCRPADENAPCDIGSGA